jgi:hypothetical protein
MNKCIFQYLIRIIGGTGGFGSTGTTPFGTNPPQNQPAQGTSLFGTTAPSTGTPAFGPFGVCFYYFFAGIALNFR